MNNGNSEIGDAVGEGLSPGDDDELAGSDDEVSVGVAELLVVETGLTIGLAMELGEFKAMTTCGCCGGKLKLLAKCSHSNMTNKKLLNCPI